MIEEKQKTQKNPSLWGKFISWFSSLAFNTKFFLLSFLTLILGLFFINNSNNKELKKYLEESKKNTEKKLKSISLYDDKISNYKKSIDNIELQIQSTESKIKEITEENQQKSTLDEFFDKRV